MNSQRDDFLDDPELLKQALNRACPRVSAPASLRQNIENALAAGSSDLAGEVPHRSWRIADWLPRGRRLAIAASIAGLGLGVGLFVLTEKMESTDNIQVAQDARPPVLVENAVARHDQLRQAIESDQAQADLASLAQLQQELRSRSFSLPPVDLNASGWSFVGAKSGQIEGCPAGQLFYRRGGQTLSVFVFPNARLGDRSLGGCAADPSRVLATREGANGAIVVVGCCPKGMLRKDEVERVAAVFAKQ